MTENWAVPRSPPINSPSNPDAHAWHAKEPIVFYRRGGQIGIPLVDHGYGKAGALTGGHEVLVDEDAEYYQPESIMLAFQWQGWGDGYGHSINLYGCQKAYVAWEIYCQTFTHFHFGANNPNPIPHTKIENLLLISLTNIAEGIWQVNFEPMMPSPRASLQPPVMRPNQKRSHDNRLIRISNTGAPYPQESIVRPRPSGDKSARMVPRAIGAAHSAQASQLGPPPGGFMGTTLIPSAGELLSEGISKEHADEDSWPANNSVHPALHVNHWPQDTLPVPSTDHQRDLNGPNDMISAVHATTWPASRTFPNPAPDEGHEKRQSEQPRDGDQGYLQDLRVVQRKPSETSVTTSKETAEATQNHYQVWNLKTLKKSKRGTRYRSQTESLGNPVTNSSNEISFELVPHSQFETSATRSGSRNKPPSTATATQPILPDTQVHHSSTPSAPRPGVSSPKYETRNPPGTPALQRPGYPSTSNVSNPQPVFPESSTWMHELPASAAENVMNEDSEGPSSAEVQHAHAVLLREQQAKLRRAQHSHNLAMSNWMSLNAGGGQAEQAIPQNWGGYNWSDAHAQALFTNDSNTLTQ
ncbi:hypothetical protein SISSUDRAFT_1066452 [Sistotremastrum suecicum HHB10207 ss-3]|uniref:Uncharacterized protein n=1 Tax=Sistotremastrum suecicum HHB10207 ss-3 TaxID=1314776 RepID=A0A165YAR3_9AGAM|nr:hypothetical protein SISSUDRAFT_1066452 [Sistotremastrum suecicum HHB10207 ss-3]